jgi:hypothetical protein
LSVAGRSVKVKQDRGDRDDDDDDDDRGPGRR